MSDLFGNHIVGFPTRWLISFSESLFCLGEEELGKLQDADNPEAKV